MTNLHKFLMAGLLCLLSFTTANAASWQGATSEPTTKIVNDTTYYVITTAEELAWFATQVNSGNTEINAILGSDIVVLEGAVTTSSYKWTPIGSDTTHAFNGIFDGDKHYIRGIYTASTRNGLFGYIGANGIARNFTIKGFKSYQFGGSSVVFSGTIAAVNLGTISSIIADSIDVFTALTGSASYLGGIAGINRGLITNSEVNSNTSFSSLYSYLNMADSGDIHAADYQVPSSGYTGGFAGLNSGEISNSTNTAIVRTALAGSGNAGGIVGYNEANGNIIGCINYGYIIGGYAATWTDLTTVGGIAGTNYGTIKKVYNHGYVRASRQSAGSTTAGGIAGRNIGGIANCKNTAPVSATDKSPTAGGIAGYNEKGGSIVNVYSAGTVLNGNTKGGVVGNNYAGANITNAYYDSTLISGISAVGSNAGTVNSSVTGHSTAEMQSDSFADILNTTNGAAENSNIWTHIYGYPIFADSTNPSIYKVTLDNDGDILTKFVKGSLVIKSSPSAASGYIFVAWLDDAGNVFTSPRRLSGDLNLTALYAEESKPQFVITFKDAGASTITTLLTGTDSLISAFPSAPDAATGMEFAGWLADNGTYVTDTTKFKKNTTVTATYKALTYAVTFLKAAGDTLSKQVESYGALPVYAGKTPAMTATAKYSYTFKGWNPAIDTVRSAAEYLAVFDSTLRSYTVKVVALQDTLLTYSAGYGTEITLPGAVNRTGYTFSGWYNTSKEKLGAPGEKLTLTGDLTIVAGLTANTYTITFKNGSTALQTSSVAYGEVPEYTGATPVQAADATYTYAFNGWTPAITMVTGTATYTATFNATKLSSSSSAGSSSAVSSSSEFSSSSESPTFTGNISAPHFTLSVAGRMLNVQNAAANSRYAVMDTQGRVLFQGTTQSKEFMLALPRSGAYFVRIGAVTKAVRVRE